MTSLSIPHLPTSDYYQWLGNSTHQHSSTVLRGYNLMFASQEQKRPLKSPSIYISNSQASHIIHLSQNRLNDFDQTGRLVRLVNSQFRKPSCSEVITIGNFKFYNIKKSNLTNTQFSDLPKIKLFQSQFKNGNYAITLCIKLTSSNRNISPKKKFSKVLVIYFSPMKTVEISLQLRVSPIRAAYVDRLLDEACIIKEIAEYAISPAKLPICRLLQYSPIHQGKAHEIFDMYFEYCEGGSLFYFQKKLPAPLQAIFELPNSDQLLSYRIPLIRNMIEAIAFLHSKGVIHRDIKLENFFVRINKDRYEVVLGDHESAINDKQLNLLIAGTFSYNPPEINDRILNREIITLTYCPKEIDIWPLGCAIYRLLTGREFPLARLYFFLKTILKVTELSLRRHQDFISLHKLAHLDRMINSLNAKFLSTLNLNTTLLSEQEMIEFKKFQYFENEFELFIFHLKYLNIVNKEMLLSLETLKKSTLKKIDEVLYWMEKKHLRRESCIENDGGLLKFLLWQMLRPKYFDRPSINELVSEIPNLIDRYGESFISLDVIAESSEF